MRLRNLLLVVLAVSLAGSLLLLAQPQRPPGADQDYDQGSPAEDPPGRAARLSLINGNVSYQPGSVEEWAQAALNHPLTVGDRLYTEDGARAELALGTASIRLNSRTAFSFLNLDDQTTQIQISEGTISVRIRRLEQDEIFEIDTPQAAFTLTRPGEYRVDVSPNGDATVITVRGGEGELTAGGESFIVPSRQQIRITGTDQVAYDRRDMPPADVFDNWCADRDRREDRSVSARYVSQDIPGYADLDDNGTWSNVPEYGEVWSPRVDADWSPYSRGHWAWVSPWGWTWVDDAPWGYAPFHYGRWAHYSNRWVWVPGPRLGRPVYSPALVAWVGGGGFSVGVGLGGGPAVGWFALGPREVYYPSYRYSPRYIERVNLTNTVIVDRRAFASRGYAVNATFVNRNARNGVVVVRQDTLVGGRSVREGSVRVSADVLRGGQVIRTAAVVPSRAAVFSGRAMVGSRAPSVTVVNRTVVARRPPPSRPVTFDRQQTELRSNPGRPLDRGSYNRLQGSQPVAQPPVRLMERPRQGGRTDQPRFNQPQQQQPAQVTPQQQQQQPQRTDRPSRFPQQQQQQPQVTPQQQQQPQPQRTDRPSRFPQQQQQPPVVTPQQQQPPQPQRTDRPSRFPQQQQQPPPQVTPPQVTPQQQQEKQRPQRPERVQQQQQPPQVTPPQVTPQQQQERQRQQRPERIPQQQQPQPQAPRVVTPPPQAAPQAQPPRPQPQQQQQRREEKQQQREQKREDKKEKKQ